MMELPLVDVNVETVELPLVDVNVETVEHTWPLLTRAVKQADFVALDLELSGLGGKRARGHNVSLEEKYKVMQDVAAQYAVLSLGVACFQWGSCDRSAVDCRVEVFNVWLMCQEPYMIDPSSASFLLQHGFDFNKQFAKGLPYNPTITELHPGDHSPRSLLAYLLHLGLPLVVHNGWLDLLFLYQSFYAPLPPSLPSFMADLSEMFQGGGVYDTKAIAEYQVRESASYLEYIFRKSQREDIQWQSEGKPHLRLRTAGYSHEVFAECVQLAPPSPLPLEAVLQLKMCSTFADHGYCNNPGCVGSHDVLIALAQEEHHAEVLRIRRKRKRDHRNQKRKAARTEDGAATGTKEATATEGGNPAEEEEEPEEQPTGSSAPDPVVPALTELFHQDLEAARVKLTAPDSRKPSFGHRAGFDAFMTGHTFACYAIRQGQMLSVSSEGGGVFSRETLMAGLGPMRNCLANRGRPIPLHIAKSHFAKTSAAHRTAQDLIRSQYGSEVMADPTQSPQ